MFDQQINFWIKRSAAPLASALLLSSCGSVDTRQSFHNVQQTVQTQTGNRVEWLKDGKEDRETEESINALLRNKLTADAAVQIALVNNRNLQAELEEIGISQADLVQAGLLKNPGFAASIRFPDRPPSPADTEFSVVQDFLDLVMLPMREKIAAIELNQTELHVANKAMDLAQDVKSAFYSLAAAHELLARLKTISEIDNAALALAEEQHKSGNISELDLETQRAISTRNWIEVTQTEAEVTSGREKINRLLGLKGSQIFWTMQHGLPPLPERDLVFESLQSQAMQYRPDLRIAREEARKLKQIADLKDNTRLLPGGVNVGADTERNPDRSRVSGPTLEVQVPLFDQGEAQVARLRAQQRQAERRAEELATDIESEIREVCVRLRFAREATDQFKKFLLPQREKILNLSQQQYNYMLKGPYDLLLARQSLAETERAYISSWRDYWLARTSLERVVGGRLPERGIPLKKAEPLKEKTK